MKTIDQLYDECYKTLTPFQFKIMSEECERIDKECFGDFPDDGERLTPEADMLFQSKATAVMEKALIDHQNEEKALDRIMDALDKLG